jgi:hypothetical protein
MTNYDSKKIDNHRAEPPVQGKRSDSRKQIGELVNGFLLTFAALVSFCKNLPKTD